MNRLIKEAPPTKERRTHCTFRRPNPRRRYIKTLALCLSYADAAVVYPGVKHPLRHQLNDLCLAGYLDRYVEEGAGRVYYKTTSKGVSLIEEALKGE